MALQEKEARSSSKWGVMMRTGLVRLILAAFMAGSLFTAMYSQIDNYLTPFIPEERYDKLILAATFVKERGWKEPIFVSYGDPGIWFVSLDRLYIGGQVGQTYIYYGKLQELYHLAPPLNKSSYRAVPDSELVTARQSSLELATRFGTDIAAVREHPVVLLTPESYSHPLSEMFAAKYHIGNGIIVIPPGALTELDINRWVLFGATDYTWKSGGYAISANWSLAPQVLEAYDLSPERPFSAHFRFGVSQSDIYSVRIHLMDFPPMAVAGLLYSPLSFFVDGELLLTHSYSGAGPMWVEGTTHTLQSGIHTIELRTDVTPAPIILDLDVVLVEPVSS